MTFFCAILRPLSLGYLCKYLRKYPKVDFCFLKSTFSFFSYSRGTLEWQTRLHETRLRQQLQGDENYGPLVIHLAIEVS